MSHDHQATYSEIIGPEDFNRIYTEEHVYIAASDGDIQSLIKDGISSIPGVAEVVELGCGPARILPLIAEIPNIHLAGVDYDPAFLAYAKKRMAGSAVSIIFTDITSLTYPKPVDIFYSQGFHHHIQKGNSVQEYLSHVHSQLKDNGLYIIGDEFLPEYTSTHDRLIKVVIWYSHVIHHAKIRHFDYLAAEEAKTFLDDLNENSEIQNIKNQEQLDAVLTHVTPINQAAEAGDMEKATALAEEFLQKYSQLRNKQLHGDTTMDLSRGDFKICESEFKKEIEQAGFVIEKKKVKGPIEQIGAIVVYQLRKQ